jgi:choline dehydrogenase-like flavoprotein
VLLRAVKLTKRIMQAQPLAEITLRELYAAETDDEIRDMIRNRADTIYHPVGTVRMGGVDAPLDPQCRVRGIEGLRVVDASVMPRITSGNTNAPTIMIAEKIAAEVAST